MQDEKRSVRLTGTQLREILRQNRMMREILEAWPARQVMMGFEKDWDQRRRAFLAEHPIMVPVEDPRVEEHADGLKGFGKADVPPDADFV